MIIEFLGEMETDYLTVSEKLSLEMFTVSDKRILMKKTIIFLLAQQCPYK